ncbi:hypothetical protein [Proteus phage VTCCBPA139]|nr:hypothetical protein [Proteus phage VTCCBPA139]
MKPHIYSKLLNELTQTAMVYKDTQQLRAQLGSTLSKYIEIEHNTGGSPNVRGNKARH